MNTLHRLLFSCLAMYALAAHGQTPDLCPIVFEKAELEKEAVAVHPPACKVEAQLECREVPFLGDAVRGNSAEVSVAVLPGAIPVVQIIRQDLVVLEDHLPDVGRTV